MSDREQGAPSLAEWQRLYEEAALFKQATPWQWLTSDDTFAVLDPETGEQHHCAIMGAAGIDYGLLVFLGSQGLLAHMATVNEVADMEEVWLSSNGMSFSLCDREELLPEDRSMAAALGLKFRGRGAWPMFRRQRPLYLPAPLQNGEPRVLTVCLEQARLLAAEVRDGLRIPDDGVNVLVRRPGPGGAWETTTAPLPDVLVPLDQPDEDRLEDLPEIAPLAATTWEARHLTVVPVQGEGGEAPHWARILLCVDHASGFILTSDLLGPRDSLLDAFMQTAETVQHLPERLLVTSQLLALQLTPVTQALGIAVEVVDELPGIDEASAAMKQAFGRRPS